MFPKGSPGYFGINLPDSKFEVERLTELLMRLRYTKILCTEMLEPV